ncbi:MAG: glycosyltransferase, partial [Janthinobacterium lividum]
MNAAASVIVRTYNSAATLGATLDSIRAQDVPAEIVVVDSGSGDATMDMVRARADVVVEIAHQEFSYGRALNLGAAAASAPVHVALSSHCVLPRP